MHAGEQRQMSKVRVSNRAVVTAGVRAFGLAAAAMLAVGGSTAGAFDAPPIDDPELAFALSQQPRLASSIGEQKQAQLFWPFDQRYNRSAAPQVRRYRNDDNRQPNWFGVQEPVQPPRKTGH